MRDAPHFRFVANGNDNAATLTVCDQTRCIRHVPPVSQSRVAIEDFRHFLHGNRLSGESGFIYLKIPCLKQAHIRGHFVTGLKKDDVARDHFRRGNALLLACTQHRCKKNLPSDLPADVHSNRIKNWPAVRAGNFFVRRKGASR